MTPLACNINAFTAAQRERHARLARRLRDAATLEGLEDGLAFVFLVDASRALELTEFMTLERLCCPFLTLELRFEPYLEVSAGTMRLSLRGPEGTPAFLRHELNLP